MIVDFSTTRNVCIAIAAFSDQIYHNYRFIDIQLAVTHTCNTYKRDSRKWIEWIHSPSSGFFFQVVVMLQQVFPLIQTLLSKWLKDTEVVEVSVINKCIKHSLHRVVQKKIRFLPPLTCFVSSQASCAVFEKSLKTLGGDFAPLVPQLCELISQLFSAYPQASALDLIQQVEWECVFQPLQLSSNALR